MWHLENILSGYMDVETDCNVQCFLAEEYKLNLECNHATLSGHR